MGRTARDRRDRPHPKPVERIELNEEHAGWRLFAAAVLLVFGAGMLAYAFSQLVAPEEEWIAAEANSTGASSAGEFRFLYRPGSGELSYAADRKAVTALYSQLSQEAFQLFHSREAFEGITNIYTINHHPNEELEVAPGLYAALAAMERSGSRVLYLGPVYERYNGLFSCTDDSQLPDFDPFLSPEVAREYGEYAAYARDPASVRVELLGRNRLRLFVSQEYLAYAGREGVERFIDFGWTRNAFVADYLAEGLAAQGFCSGVLTSFDGFVRNMDDTGQDFAFQFYDRQGQTVYPAAVMHYRGPMNAVSLRDFPTEGLDSTRFYQLRSGEIRTPYVDPADGLSRSAVHNLTCYARDKSCGEMLLAMLPVYIADDFQPEALETLAAEGVYAIYCENSVIHSTDRDVALTELYAQDGVRYTAAPAGQ